MIITLRFAAALVSLSSYSAQPHGRPTRKHGGSRSALGESWLALIGMIPA
ncbi:MAG TPA: hypothetical protein VFP26_01945 [Gemmatimonadaceae bacterium]|nr:hypothetical protein [Gemmatimonadaceae bacterium]